MRASASAFAPNELWSNALRYAGASFEAYLDLDAEDVHLSRRTPNGTLVSYLDVEFLESAFEGVVKLEVLSAKLGALNTTTWWNPFSTVGAFKGDPFVQASIDGGNGRTETKWGNPSPVFDENIFLFVKEKRSGRLVLRLMDENVALASQEIGKAFVMLGALESGHRQEFELSTTGAGGNEVSSLCCAVTYVPLKDNALIEDLVLAKEEVLSEEELGETSKRMIRTLFAKSVGMMESRWRAAADGDLTPVAFLDNEGSDTQAYVFIDRVAKEIVVAFRGTEQTEWRDVLSDLNLLPTNIQYDEGRLQRCDSTLDDTEIWVHRGFLDAFLSVAAEVRELVIDQIANRDPGQWTLVTTGHSLGGALSTLAAFELASKSKETGKFKSVVNYNYGSPMVGNKAFANAFNALVPDCYRFANAKDAVTFVPRLVGFSHVGKRVTLFEDGSARFNDQDADVGDGITSEDLIKRLTFAKLDELTDLAGDKYKKNIEDTVGKLLPMLTPDDDRASGIDLDQILDAEKEALLGLIEGDGVEEHLEDIYWDRLKDKSGGR